MYVLHYISPVNLMKNLLINKTDIIQWNLRIKDMLGQEVLSFIERFPLFGSVDLSFIALFGVSFIGGFTVMW